MRIAVTGTNGVGKSTFINDMLQQWSCFSKPETDFRSKIRKRYTTTVNSKRQKKILKLMTDQLRSYGRGDNVIYDRCPIDNMVYTLYGYAKEHGITDKFVKQTAEELKKALRMIDLVLFIPITKHGSVCIEDNLEDKGDLTEEYAIEIDNIFKSLYKEWSKRESPYVDFEDKPHVLEIFGTPEERIEMVKLYIDVAGDAYGEGNIIAPDELEGLHNMSELLTQQEEEVKESKYNL